MGSSQLDGGGPPPKAQTAQKHAAGRAPSAPDPIFLVHVGEMLPVAYLICSIKPKYRLRLGLDEDDDIVATYDRFERSVR